MHRRFDCIVQGASGAADNASASALREVHFIGCWRGRSSIEDILAAIEAEDARHVIDADYSEA
jgi:hypothetical protein